MQSFMAEQWGKRDQKYLENCYATLKILMVKVGFEPGTLTSHTGALTTLATAAIRIVQAYLTQVGILTGYPRWSSG